MPNKVFSIMASARPVLAVTPVNSELARLVLDTGCGFVVSPGNKCQLADTIRNMESDPVGNAEMGVRGRERMVKEYSRQRCVQAFDDVLLGLAH
jgi:glycosyltransferase involved in cell wall biosynthesis